MLNIRPFESSDRDAIRRMAQQTVLDGTVFPFENLQGVEDYWYVPSGRIWVATQGTQVVGTYVLKPNYADRCAHVAGAGYMVDEQARGLGIGYALGQHSLNIARQSGYLAMQFNQVVATNQAAVRLWKKLGFEIIGRVPGGFRHRDQGWVDLLIMFRRLDGTTADSPQPTMFDPAKASG